MNHDDRWVPTRSTRGWKGVKHVPQGPALPYRVDLGPRLDKIREREGIVSSVFDAYGTLTPPDNEQLRL